MIIKKQTNAIHTDILGIDIGTSGMRAVVVDAEGRTRYSHQVSMPFPKRSDLESEQTIEVWRDTFEQLLEGLANQQALVNIGHIISDATSSTVFLADEACRALTPALMYDDKRAVIESETIQRCAPENSGAHGASSTLAKVMWLQTHALTTVQAPDFQICHQIDWLTHYLTGKTGITDENNALKLGYDPIKREWPQWLRPLLNCTLPKVVSPGTAIGLITPEIAQRFDLPKTVQIHAGTTDSIAAFLAAGASRIGDAVTSLGSTLAIKVLSDRPVFSAVHGIYSHRLNDVWLVGGASNSGGAVLLKYFSLEELKKLIPKIDASQRTDLNYYPLTSPGERFPIANTVLPPRIEPIPDSPTRFLHGLLEGLTEIERLGYEKLAQLGCPQVRSIYTAGGGVQNAAWMAIRARELPAPIKKAAQTDAAFGVTRLIYNQPTST